MRGARHFVGFPGVSQVDGERGQRQRELARVGGVVAAENIDLQRDRPSARGRDGLRGCAPSLAGQALEGLAG